MLTLPKNFRPVTRNAHCFIWPDYSWTNFLVVAIFISVLECPNKDFLKNLTSCEQLLKMAEAGAEVEELTPCVMVHMSPSAIVEETEYQEFISRFV